MRAIVLLLLAIVAAAPPAHAQLGLTPEKQIYNTCQRLMELRGRGFGDGTAIDAACGSDLAVQETIAAGGTGILNLQTLIAAARAARAIKLHSPVP